MIRFIVRYKAGSTTFSASSWKEAEEKAKVFAQGARYDLSTVEYERFINQEWKS